MAKEEYETPLIDSYNRAHLDVFREDGSWYHRFLPPGVFLEELSEEFEEELIAAYNECEREAEDLFERSVHMRFAEIFDQLDPVDLRGLLPMKPPIAWNDLPVNVQRGIQLLYDEGTTEEVTERTLKKRVRQYLIERFIIEE